MPFTFSHPAAILPAKILPRHWISLSALIAGSIVPDFEYFIRMKCLGLYSHTFWGMFWFDLPLAFVLTYVYHLLVRDTLIDNLPVFLRGRLNRYKAFDWATYVKQNIWVVLLSLFVGIASHILWDSFTHRNGYFVKRIPWLLLNTEIMGLQHVRFYILQTICSAIGLLAVIVAIMAMPKDATAEKRSIVKYWLIAICIAVVIIVIRTMFYTFKPTDEFLVLSFLPVKRIPEDLIMTSISAGLIALMITPLILGKWPKLRF